MGIVMVAVFMNSIHICLSSLVLITILNNNMYYVNIHQVLFKGIIHQVLFMDNININLYCLYINVGCDLVPNSKTVNNRLKRWEIIARGVLMKVLGQQIQIDQMFPRKLKNSFIFSENSTTLIENVKDFCFIFHIA